MEPVERVSGKALPLGYSDVDTDQIVPSDALKRIERTGFGQFLFSGWREDEEFIMNRDEHEDAVILIAGENFGSGSSREHAVWAIKDHGFDAVIAPSFADIFKNTSTKNLKRSSKTYSKPSGKTPRPSLRSRWTNSP
jgi:3-isopropylmalate/(R)-2-methylmalate dehydratase small subunit